MFAFQMLIHRYKICARFGLMHMVATNICVWLRVLVVETVREIQDEPVNSKDHTENSSLDPSSYTNLAHNNNAISDAVNGFDEVKFMKLREDGTPGKYMTTGMSIWYPVFG